MKPAYNKHSPATSIGWGVFVSTTWGRHSGERLAASGFGWGTADLA